MSKPNVTLPDAENEVLTRLTRKSSMPLYLATVNGSNIYQVSGWQSEALKDDQMVRTVTNTTDLESAVQDPASSTLLVVKNASITQAVATKILERNPLQKTIFWEV